VEPPVIEEDCAQLIVHNAPPGDDGDDMGMDDLSGVIVHGICVDVDPNDFCSATWVLLETGDALDGTNAGVDDSTGYSWYRFKHFAPGSNGVLEAVVHGVLGFGYGKWNEIKTHTWKVLLSREAQYFIEEKGSHFCVARCDCNSPGIRHMPPTRTVHLLPNDDDVCAAHVDAPAAPAAAAAAAPSIYCFLVEHGRYVVWLKDPFWN
jgi:hypothetical protein